MKSKKPATKGGVKECREKEDESKKREEPRQKYTGRHANLSLFNQKGKDDLKDRMTITGVGLKRRVLRARGSSGQKGNWFKESDEDISESDTEEVSEDDRYEQERQKEKTQYRGAVKMKPYNKQRGVFHSRSTT